MTRTNASVRCSILVLERFRDSHFTDRITYRQSVKLIRNLEFRASQTKLSIRQEKTREKEKERKETEIRRKIG